MLNSSILGIDSGKIDRFVVARNRKNQDLLAGIKRIVNNKKELHILLEMFYNMMKFQLSF